MITGFWSCEGEERRRKEHSLIVRMRNEQAYALVFEGLGARMRHCDRVTVQARQRHCQQARHQ